MGASIATEIDDVADLVLHSVTSRSMSINHLDPENVDSGLHAQACNTFAINEDTNAII